MTSYLSSSGFVTLLYTFLYFYSVLSRLDFHLYVQIYDYECSTHWYPFKLERLDGKRVPFSLYDLLGRSVLTVPLISSTMFTSWSVVVWTLIPFRASVTSHNNVNGLTLSRVRWELNSSCDLGSSYCLPKTKLCRWLLVSLLYPVLRGTTESTFTYIPSLSPFPWC